MTLPSISSDGELAAEIGERVIERLLDHQAKILVGMRLGEFRDPAGDHVNGPHSSPVPLF